MGALLFVPSTELGHHILTLGFDEAVIQKHSTPPGASSAPPIDPTPRSSNPRFVRDRATLLAASAHEH